MAKFRHPSLMDLIEKYGIPRYQFDRNVAELSEFSNRLLVIYYKSDDRDNPINGVLGTMGICNVWGRFLFPRDCCSAFRIGTYIRLPRKDKALLRELIADQTREKGPVRHAPVSSSRYIDIGGNHASQGG